MQILQSLHYILMQFDNFRFDDKKVSNKTLSILEKISKIHQHFVLQELK